MKDFYVGLVGGFMAGCLFVFALALWLGEPA